MARSSKRAWKLQEFQAHASMVNCLAIGHKSGKVVVTGGEDRKVNLWAVGKMSCILSLRGHTSPVESVGFNSSEDVVAAGSHSGAMKIWNLEASKILRTLSGHKSGIRSFDFHPFGDIIASGSVDTNIKLWDFRTKNCIFTYKGHANSVNSIQFSPDGKWIASASDDSTVRLWEISSGKLVYEFKDHTAPVTSVKFHPIDFLLAAGSSDRTMKFWDLETFQLVSSTDGDCGAIRTITMHPDGGCAYAACQDYLMVYGWEPAVTFDSVSTGWGRAADIVVHQNELVGGSFQQSSVSIYIADLMKIQPFGSTQDVQTRSYNNSNSPFVQNPSRRRSFITKNQSSARIACQDSCHKNETNLSEESRDAHGEQANPHLAYDEIFNPRKELAREHPAFNPDLKSLSVSQVPSSSASTEPRKLPAMASSPPSNSEDSSQKLPIMSAPMEIPSSRPCRRPPVTNFSYKMNLPHNKHFMNKEDEQEDVYVSTFGKGGALDVNVDDFILKSRQLYSNMDDEKAISIIRSSHHVHLSVLSTRNKNLQVFKTLWTSGNIKVALDSAVSMNDPAILQDVVHLLLQRPSSWTLETCSCVLPVLSTLISSRYETQVNTGLNAVKFILRSFAMLIKDTLSNVSSIGVDISKEERYNRSLHCHKLLMGIRDNLDKMYPVHPQNLQFKEIRLLLSQLD